MTMTWRCWWGHLLLQSPHSDYWSSQCGLIHHTCVCGLESHANIGRFLCPKCAYCHRDWLKPSSYRWTWSSRSPSRHDPLAPSWSARIEGRKTWYNYPRDRLWDNSYPCGTIFYDDGWGCYLLGCSRRWLEVASFWKYLNCELILAVSTSYNTNCTESEYPHTTFSPWSRIHSLAVGTEGPKMMWYLVQIPLMDLLKVKVANGLVGTLLLVSWVRHILTEPSADSDNNLESVGWWLRLQMTSWCAVQAWLTSLYSE